MDENQKNNPQEDRHDELRHELSQLQPEVAQEDKAEEERGFRYFEIWDENGQSAKFYIVEQYLELSQSMMEAIAESLAKGEGK